MSATIAPPEIADSLKPGEHLSTFGGNPISCAAVSANIEVMREEELPQVIGAEGRARDGPPARDGRRHPLIGEVRGLGLMIGVELVTDRTTKEPAKAKRPRSAASGAGSGVLVGVGGQGGNVVRIQPPLVIADDDLDRALDVVDHALTQAANT